jgi:hypothetical protein
LLTQQTKKKEKSKGKSPHLQNPKKFNDMWLMKQEKSLMQHSNLKKSEQTVKKSDNQTYSKSKKEAKLTHN